MAGKAFLSYSRQDKDRRNELLPMLRAVADVRESLWFDEQEIKVGDEFHPKIEEALEEAKVALLLVSNDFLNSDYIRRHELPFVLRRHRDGGMRLGILYLTSIPANALSIDWASGGRSGKTKLTDIHSFNAPNAPLDLLDAPGERNKVYAEVADWLAEELAEKREQPSPPPPLRAAGLHDARRPELAICISSRHNQWQHHFYLPLEPQAIRPKLDCPEPDRIHPDSIDGKTLFELLFGSEPDQAGHLLAAAFGTGRTADPTHSPLRVHLVTGDRTLQALPWSDIAYRGRPLRDDGWTVELHADNRLGFPACRNHVCYFPGRVLLVASTAESRTRHLDDLGRFFQRNWRQNPEPAEARSANALRDALRVGSTRLVYYYGLASKDGLLLEDRADGDLVAWAKLADWLGEAQSVDLVFLNLLGEAARPALASGAVLVSRVKAAVLVQCSPLDRAHAAAKSGSDWLAAVFAQRFDPVQALYREPVGTISAWTSYATWQTIRPARLEHPDLVNLLLDRHRQRDALTGARDDFYTYHSRTIHHVVALGTPGCLTNDFPAMIRQHLVGNSRDAQREVYAYQAIDLSRGIDEARSVDLAVRRRFNLLPHESLLSRMLEPDALAGATFAFLLLGWRVSAGGVGGAGADERNFLPAAQRLLRAVSDWCCNQLGQELAARNRVGPHVRVVSIVALESEHADELNDQLDELIEAYGGEQRFHFEKLDRLSAVALTDLRKYFRNPEICTCDERYREQFPALMLGGRKEMPFEEAVSTIRRGDPDNWANLFDELTDLTASKAWPPAHYDPTFWSARDAR